MTASTRTIRVGTRSSNLALLQTRFVIGQLAKVLPDFQWSEVSLSSPGDRDLAMDLRVSPADFFTKDLDDKVRAGELDCAIHSAKDVPEPIGVGLDWFWLPWREDARDAIILPKGKSLSALPAAPRIGVSSDRREAYCLKRFPSAQLLPLRGTIEERLRQLDAGAFDVIVMAGAALVRLGLEDRVSEWIPLLQLPPPEGQGALATTFRAGDPRFLRLRRLYVKAVTFAAAGVGSAGACTLESLQALKRCDIVLHDTLFGHELLNLVPPGVRFIDVGKRCGEHSVPQSETTYMITRYARQGLRVVRLKGGDPGIFGRLAEEVDALDALEMPYRVLPGVTSLSSATTGTGMLLTRRGVSRGFTVMTPRKEGGALGEVTESIRRELPMVFFMALSAATEVSRQLIGEGRSPQTPAAVVYGAGSDQSWVLEGDLSNIATRIKEAACEMPGLLIIGEAARYRYRKGGAFEGRRVLLTASDALQDKAAGLVADYGGLPVCRPLIRLVVTPEAAGKISRLREYDWVVLTSPSAVRCFGELLHETGTDFRAIPKIVSCGGGTTQELRKLGLAADIEPAAGFGAEGLLAAVKPLVTPGLRVLRLRSDKAGAELAGALRSYGAEVDDCLLYRNEALTYPFKPEFDVAYFASASAVEVYLNQWGGESLKGKFVVAIGKPTLAALQKAGLTADLVPGEATVEASMVALAEYYTRKELT